MKIIQSMKNMQPQQRGITADTLHQRRSNCKPCLGVGSNKRVNAWEAPACCSPQQGQWEPCLLSTSRIKLCFSIMFNTIG